MDSTSNLHTKLIEEAQNLAKETSRKLQTRVASDTYDYEIAYLKNVITSLRGQIEELKQRPYESVKSNPIKGT